MGRLPFHHALGMDVGTIDPIVARANLDFDLEDSIVPLAPRAALSVEAGLTLDPALCTSQYQTQTGSQFTICEQPVAWCLKKVRATRNARNIRIILSTAP